MNLKFNYFDNILSVKEDKITSLEIENKGCFYRTITNLIKISNGDIIEEIYFFDNNKEEINISNKILIISDYFNFQIILKKYSNHLQKLIIDNTNDETLNTLTVIYKKLIEKIKKIFGNIDFEITFNDEFNLEQLIKFLKPTIKEKQDLINNLYLIVDLEKCFKLNKIIVFVNLKQYLTKEELNEFYKYCIYNKITILLIENESHQTTLNNEQKLILDDDLDEFMI